MDEPFDALELTAYGRECYDAGFEAGTHRDLIRVSTFEVVDALGRTFMRLNCRVTLSYHDHGRTLTVFLSENPE